MKKYRLILVILALLIGFSGNLAKASDECAPGHLFSIFTGKSCNTNTTNYVFTRDLSAALKSRGADVVALQQFLKNEGYFFGKVDGKFGKITGRAVGDFQEDNDLSRTEIADAATRAVLNKTSVILPTNNLSINPDNATIKIGEKTQLQALLNTCPLGAQCFVGPLPVQATWTSSNTSVASVLYKNVCPSGQYCIDVAPDYLTAVVTGVKEGTATITASYTNSSGVVSTATALINVYKTKSSTVTVLSPNGGETWLTGTTQAIKWQDNGAAPAYDIYLQAYREPCTSNICPMYMTPAPLTIAKGVYGSSYNWLVGTAWGQNIPVSDGMYTIQVCQTSTSNCDSSDSYFKIVKSQLPVFISSLSITSGVVGAQVTITGTGFTATGNKIKFGDLGVENSPNYNLNSNGTSITFTVPFSNYMTCWDTHPACEVMARATQPGTYDVSVINTNGTSNARSFTVTNANSSCALTAQISNIKTYENNTTWAFDVTVNATNKPATSNGWTTNFQGYVPTIIPYGTVYHYGNFFLSSGPLQLTPKDQVDSNCTTIVTIYPPTQTVSAPVVSTIFPTSGYVGATITLTGSGFTPGVNKLKFGDLGTENSPTYSLSSYDGKTLYFIIPSSNYVSCWYTNPACNIAAKMTQPGTYPVSIINANGKSNTINFVVTGTSFLNQTIFPSL